MMTKRKFEVLKEIESKDSRMMAKTNNQITSSLNVNKAFRAARTDKTRGTDDPCCIRLDKRVAHEPGFVAL